MTASFVPWPQHALRMTEQEAHHLENHRSQILSILQKRQRHRSWEIENDGHCDGSRHGCENGSVVNRIGDCGGGCENDAVVNGTSPSVIGQ